MYNVNLSPILDITCGLFDMLKKLYIVVKVLRLLLTGSNMLRHLSERLISLELDLYFSITFIVDTCNTFG